MDNFLGGQAKAIWDALDTMLKEDPQAYQKFVKEQLEEGRQMVQKEKQENSSSSEANALGKMFSGMNIGKGPEGLKGYPRVKKVESSKDDKKLSGKCGEGDAGACGPLLDDEIGRKSILTQIVKGGVDDSNHDEEENGPKLSELKIPPMASTSSTGPSKKRPLIEEL